MQRSHRLRQVGTFLPHATHILCFTVSHILQALTSLSCSVFAAKSAFFTNIAGVLTNFAAVQSHQSPVQPHQSRIFTAVARHAPALCQAVAADASCADSCTPADCSEDSKQHKWCACVPNLTRGTLS